MSKIVYFEDYKCRPGDALPQQLQAVAVAAGAVRVHDDSAGISGGVLIAPMRDGRFGVFVFNLVAGGRVVPVRTRSGNTAYVKDEVVSRHHFKDFDRAVKKALALAA